jgi:hypothetical protein
MQPWKKISPLSKFSYNDRNIPPNFCAELYKISMKKSMLWMKKMNACDWD